MASNASSSYSSGESEYHIADQGGVCDDDSRSPENHPETLSTPPENELNSTVWKTESLDQYRQAHGFDLHGLKWALAEADESSDQDSSLYQKWKREFASGHLYKVNGCQCMFCKCTFCTAPYTSLCSPAADCPICTKIEHVLREQDAKYATALLNAEEDHRKPVKDMHNMLLRAIDLKAKLEQEQKTHQENLQKRELERANLARHYHERAADVAKTHEHSVQALVTEYSIRFQTLENQCEEKLENSPRGQLALKGDAKAKQEETQESNVLDEAREHYLKIATEVNEVKARVLEKQKQVEELQKQFDSFSLSKNIPFFKGHAKNRGGRRR